MQTRYSEEWAAWIRRLGMAIVREPLQRRSWAELGYFLLSSAFAFAVLDICCAFGLVGILLAVAFVGVLVLAGGLRVARGFARWQLALAQWILDEEIEAPAPFLPPPGFFGWLRAALSDRAAWRAVGYFVAKIPLALFGTWFALSCWLEAVFCIVSSLAGSSAPLGFGFFARFSTPSNGQASIHAFGPRIGVLCVGIVFALVAPWAMRLVVNFDRRLMHVLLGPEAASSRLRSLEESRARTVDAATTTLRRIERDLHDGTQAQLVAVAMRLGQAKDKLQNLGSDPAKLDRAELEAIRRLVDEAHGGAKEAIVDLRDLARGIHPPALDTGLENALTTLAARSPIPTEVTVEVPGRLSASIEAISYFCAAELLANVAQHANASRASLSCVQHGPWLRIVVRDDGRGGAAVHRQGSTSSGLAGLSDRVRAVDGYLSLASPLGGPTVVTVDIPAQGPGDA